MDRILTLVYQKISYIIMLCFNMIKSRVVYFTLGCIYYHSTINLSLNRRQNYFLSLFYFYLNNSFSFSLSAWIRLVIFFLFLAHSMFAGCQVLVVANLSASVAE